MEDMRSKRDDERGLGEAMEGKGPEPPFRITGALRDTLKGNIGELVPDSALHSICSSLHNSPTPVAAVGDITVIRLFQCGVIPDLCIVDMGTHRGGLKKEEAKEMEALFSRGRVVDIENPGGAITLELWKNIEEFYKKFKITKLEREATVPLILRIHGEEDMASLPCIYLSPEGGHVCYGLPEKGLVHIEVNERHRLTVRDVLKRMEA